MAGRAGRARRPAVTAGTGRAELAQPAGPGFARPRLGPLGPFSLISSAERSVVLAARTRAVREQLAHYEAMRDLAVAHGERWGALVTGEMIRRHRQELTWLAELGDLAAQPDPEP